MDKDSTRNRKIKKKSLTEEERNEIKRIRENKQKFRIKKSKLFFLLTFFFLTTIFLIYKTGEIVYVKAVEGEYKKQATIQQTSNFDQVIIANRGNITDKNGEILAISNTVYDIIIDVHNAYAASFSTEEKRNEAIEKNIVTLSTVLNKDRSEIEKYYEKDSSGVPIYNDSMYMKIASKVSYDAYKEILEADLLSVYTVENTKRSYPKNNIASQIVGFMTGDNASNYYGIENQYNEYLLGVDGRKFTTYNEEGENYLNVSPSVNGNKIVTTIDSNLQKIAEDISYEYGEKYKAQNAAILVMNANTSEILAMGQYPTFNNNYPGEYSYFNKTNFGEKYEALEDEDDKFKETMSVWRNFSVAYTFEPGSTYKVSVVAAALEEKIITKDEVFFCNGSKEVGDYVIKCWNENGHGLLNAAGILENSCNVGMMEIAEKMGEDTFLEYQENFGFGQLTGIDLPGEESGYMFERENFNETELATSSMGQGFNATALQSLNAFASVINGGNLMKPYIVSEIVSEDNTVVYRNQPTLLRKTVSKETSDYLRLSLQNVIDVGTGKNAQIIGYNIGGKTATGEQGNRDDGLRTISFIGYFPVENPEYIVMSVLHLPEEKISGGGEGAPMAKDMMSAIIEYYTIPPTSSINSTSDAVDSSQISVPDVVGLSVNEAVERLISVGIDYQVMESGGTVARTFPSASTIMNRDGRVLIYTSGGTKTENDEEGESSNFQETEEIEGEVSSEINSESTEGSSVTIDVTTIEESVPMSIVPNVVDLSLSLAVDTLETLEFKYVIYTYYKGSEVLLSDTLISEDSENAIDENQEIDYNEYTVVRQSHKEGIETPKNSSIRLVVEKNN
ncbi:MAG: penicillin-binding transpeptidase domain-containing protein [Lachnospirales bacterium]